jgi:hypothetical protein
VLWLATAGLCLAVAGVPRVSQAESALRQAEQAYNDVDFETTIRHGEEALASGTLEPEQVARAYHLLGISANALGQRAQARRYFIRLLAVDANAESIERQLAPSQRESLMEARGFWASHRIRLDVSVDLVPQRGSLRIRLTDPADMVQAIEVRARLGGQDSYAQSSVTAANVSYVEVEGAAETPHVEYTLALLDEHGNRLLQRGDEEVPDAVGSNTSTTTVVATDTTSEGTTTQPAAARSRTWLWIVLGVAAAAVVGGAIATGVVLHQQSQTVSIATEVKVGF